MAEDRVKEIIASTIDQGTGPEVSPIKSDMIAAKTIAAIEADPVAANASNKEPKVQSRIVWGGSAGVGSLALLLAFEILENGTQFGAYDTKVVIPAITALWGAAFVLYGRLMPGLKPMFYGWFGKG